MKLLEQAKQRILELGHCKAAYTVAHVAAASCDQRYGVSLLRISSGLDERNKDLVVRFLSICQEGDYRNASQYEMLEWLDENDFLATVPMQKPTE